MYIQQKNQWKPSPVPLVDYAEECKYWRQGVSLHVLRQNITAAHKVTVSQPEFANEAELSEFRLMNSQETVLCQSSTSSSEVTEVLLRDCLLKDEALRYVEYLIYCHRSIDLEFYTSPACRAQNALQNHRIVPISLSQCGTAAGLYGIEMAMALGASAAHGVVISLNELGIMPARRRILRDLIVDDGSSILHVCSDCTEQSSVHIETCETVQYEITPTCADDLIPAFQNLVAKVQLQLGNIDGLLTVLPKYSDRFQYRASSELPVGPDYIFENRGSGYSGINFASNALSLFVESETDRAVMIQVSETGAGAVCTMRRNQ